MNKRLRLRYFKTGVVLLLFGLAVFFGYRNESSDIQILPFDKGRDAEFIKESFKGDWYWLTNNPDFSPQFMMDNMTPRRNPKYFGKQKIIVLSVKNETVGFGAYFMKNFYEGKVHFLDIHKEYRGHGYSVILMKYMIKKLFESGAKIIKLDTRVNNIPARALYSKLGFSEVGKDDGFVHFEMRK
jgi:ribosomal protein S18 acetylase RimI-like enzyme